MCLAIPARILQRDDLNARVDIDGLELDVDVSLVPDAVVGDHVVVHAGIALAVMTQEESQAALAARRALAAWQAADDTR